MRIIKIIFYNHKNEAEILLSAESVMDNGVIFNVQVDHNPFRCSLRIASSNEDIKHNIDVLEKMYYMKLLTGNLYLDDTDFVISLEMEQTCHINADVNISAGERGNLNFTFDIDQSFLPDLIKQFRLFLQQ